MNMIAFRLALGFLRVLSFLPLKVLYVFSGALRFFAADVFRYRRKVVFENLRSSFPEVDEAGIRMMARGFYRYFATLMVEGIKGMDFDAKMLARQIRFRNTDIIDRYYEQGRSVVAIAAHYGNWEWLQGLAHDIRHQPIAVYKPLNNPYADHVINRQRGRFGAEMVSMRDIIRVLRKYRRQGKPTLSMYISDQSPVWEEIQYWTNFLHQMTPVYLGPEKIAREFGMAVVYFKMHVMAKGQYEVEIIPVSENAAVEQPFEVTEKHVRQLEQNILEKPEYWLWSHRRWKLTRKREHEEKAGRYRFEGKFLKKQVKPIADA